MSFVGQCNSCRMVTDCLLFHTNPSGLSSDPKTRYVICRVCLGIVADTMRNCAVRDSCKHCFAIAKTVRDTLEGRAPEGMIHIPTEPHSPLCRLVRRVPLAS